MLTVQPYVKVYNDVVAYRARGIRYADAARHKKTPKQEALFSENRMLAMRACEEQMHLITRHFTYGLDFPNSLAWEVLFNMFLHERQAFAEMTLPSSVAK